MFKENIRVGGKHDIPTKVMATTLFALFAEVERDLISERTREGLARSRASGRKLGRPKRSPGVSRLDGKEDEAGASSNATSAPARWRGFDERVDINCSGVMAPRRRVSPSSRPPGAFGRADPGDHAPALWPGRVTVRRQRRLAARPVPAAGRAAPRLGNGYRPSSSKLRR